MDFGYHFADGVNALKQEIILACENNDVDRVNRILGIELGKESDEVLWDNVKYIITLQEAVSRGKLDIVKLVISYNSDMKTEQFSRLNEIFWNACSYKGNSHIVEYLLGLDSIDKGVLSQFDWGCVHFAAYGGDLSILKILEKSGCDLKSIIMNGRNTIHLATIDNSIEKVRYLYNKGVDPNVTDVNGRTCLHYAASINLELVSFLVEYCHCNIHISDNMDRTALEEADKVSMPEIAAYLWRKGLDNKILRTNKYFIKDHRPRILNSPSIRSNFPVAFIDNKIYLIGGNFTSESSVNSEYSLGQSEYYESDFWYLDLNKVAHTSMIPDGANLSHSDCVIDKSRLSNHEFLHDDQLVIETHYVDMLVWVPVTKEFLKHEKVGYFEVAVIDMGKDICIGISECNIPVISSDKRFQRCLCGYSGNDGKYLCCKKFPGEKFGSGDTIGCGINFETDEIWFTKNGVYMGSFITCYKPDSVHPVVGYEGCVKFKLNFGTEPFKFDFIVPTLCWTPIMPVSLYGEYYFPAEGKTSFFVIDINDINKGLEKHNFNSEYTNIFKTEIIDEKFLVVISIYLDIIHISHYWPNLNHFEYICKKDLGNSHRYYSVKIGPTRILICIITNNLLSDLYEYNLVTNELNMMNPQKDQINTILIAESYERSFFTVIDGKLAVIIDKIVILYDIDKLIYEKFEINSYKPKTSSFSATNFGKDIITVGGRDGYHPVNDIFIFCTEKMIWYKPSIVGTNIPRARYYSGLVCFETDIDKFTLDYRDQNFYQPIVTVEKVFSELRDPVKATFVDITSPGDDIFMQKNKLLNPLLKIIYRCVLHINDLLNCKGYDYDYYIDIFEGADNYYEDQNPNINSIIKKFINDKVINFNYSYQSITHMIKYIIEKMDDIYQLNEKDDMNQKNIISNNQSINSDLYCKSECKLSNDMISNDQGNKVKKPWIVSAMGWNGQSMVSDIDFISLDYRPYEFQVIGTLLNNPKFSDIKIVFTKDDSNVGSQYAHKVILKCRSTLIAKYLSENITCNDYVVNEPSSLFMPLLNVIYCDSVDFDNDYLRENYRIFILLVDKYAPDLSQRLIEQFVSTKVYAKSLLYTHLSTMLLQSEYSDISFKVNDIIYPAHKCVICTMCEYFDVLINGEFKESTESVITIKDINSDSFLVILKYFYSKKIDYDTIGDIIEIFKFAGKYDILELKNDLRYIVGNNINENNFANILIFADQEHDLKLKNACYTYIYERADKLIDNEYYLENSERVISILRNSNMNDLILKLNVT